MKKLTTMATTKKSALIGLSIVAAVALAACNKKSPNPSGNGEKQQSMTDQMKQSSQQLADNAKQDWNNIKDWTAEKRAEFEGAVQNQYANLQPQIADLKNKAASASDAAKENASAAWQKVEASQKTFQEKLADLKNASGDAFSAAKADLDKAWENLKSAVKNAKEKTSDS